MKTVNVHFQRRTLNNRQVKLVAMVAIVTVALIAPNIGNAQEQASPGELFREFYEPLLPRLKASYSNIRFAIAESEAMSLDLRVTFYRGVIRGAEYNYDSFPQQWFRSSGSDEGKVNIGDLRTKYKELKNPERSGGFFGNYSYQVVGSWGEGAGRPRELLSSFAKPNGSLDFNPYILGPLASPRNMATFEEIMNDDSFEIIDFHDRRKRNGQQVKSLYYRNHRRSKAIDRGESIFEADFDPKTGACVSLSEVTFEDDPLLKADPYVVEIQYGDSSENPDLLPAPVVFTGTLSGNVAVLEYDRVGELQDDEVSVAAFGFDVSELGPQRSLGQKVMGGTTNILVIIAIVLVALLAFVLGLMVLIGLIAKSQSKKGIPQTDPMNPHNASDSREPSDLSS